MSKAALYAPESFHAATRDQRNEVCNGCGSQSALFDYVPDTIWGLDISQACNVHDWMWHTGLDERDRTAADLAFLNNMLRLIDAAEGVWFMKWLRRKRALKYYNAVRDFGGAKYWENKNAPNEVLHVNVKTGRGLA